MFDKLEDILRKLEEIVQRLGDEGTTLDSRQVQKLLKEQAELQPIAEVEADMQANNTRQLGYAMYGGESREQLLQRAAEFLKLVENGGHQTVAAFSHWGCIGAILDQVMGITVPKMHMVCKNCTVCIFAYEKGIWKLHSWINPDNDIAESI